MLNVQVVGLLRYVRTIGENFRIAWMRGLIVRIGDRDRQLQYKDLIPAYHFVATLAMKKLKCGGTVNEVGRQDKCSDVFQYSMIFMTSHIHS